MELLGYLILGVAVAAFGTLVGIGGGLILVPLFILVFHWEPNLAVGTSLVVVFFNVTKDTSGGQLDAASATTRTAPATGSAR